MRKIIYSVAMSLDGFIAGPNGEADWIVMDPEIDFEPMMARFDTILMGRRTFEATQAMGGGVSMPGGTTSKKAEVRTNPGLAGGPHDERRRGSPWSARRTHRSSRVRSGPADPLWRGRTEARVGPEGRTERSRWKRKKTGPTGQHSARITTRHVWPRSSPRGPTCRITSDW